MPALPLADISLHYEIDGAGPPLLLIAGMASDSASWQPVMALLCDHFTVIRPDNRTTGRTTPWDAPASVQHNAADCAALLDHLGYDSAHVLGHSMGGLIGLQLAHDDPGRVHSLTLAASAPMRMARNIALFDALIEIRHSDAAPDLWLRTFFPWLFAPAIYDDHTAVDAATRAALAYPHAQSAAAMRHQLDGLAQYDPGAANARQPVQALLGECDLLLPEALARKALAALTDHRIHTAPGAGHSLHWDAPEWVAKHLCKFTRAHPF